MKLHEDILLYLHKVKEYDCFYDFSGVNECILGTK